MDKKKIDILICLSAALLLVFTAFPLIDVEINYGFIRVYIFSASILLFPDQENDRLKILLIIIGLLFNPIFKVRLSSEVWIGLDILGAILFISLALQRARTQA